MADRCGHITQGQSFAWICVAEPHGPELGHHSRRRVLPVCPECRAGKHTNCAGDALDEQLDEITECNCAQTFHQDRSPT